MVTSLFSSTFIHTVRVKCYSMLPGTHLVNTDANNFVLAESLFNVSALSKTKLLLDCSEKSQNTLYCNRSIRFLLTRSCTGACLLFVIQCG